MARTVTFKGNAVNLNHDPPFNNELKLNTETSTFPFIWVSLSQRCTIAKINTETGEILGEFRTISDSVGCNESSRTTVALDGSAWPVRVSSADYARDASWSPDGSRLAWHEWDLPDMPWDASAHSNVLQALARKDPAAARRAIERDIRNTATFLLKFAFNGTSGPLAVLRGEMRSVA